MYHKDKDDCPRGFHFCKDKQECVPERVGVEDKLELKYERYFFKEDKIMTQKCEKGYRWCPIQKKCVPEDDVKGQGRRQGRGQGKGPMGSPMKEASDLVDLAFDEGFEIFSKSVKTIKKVDRILDTIEERDEKAKTIDFGKGSISTTGRPYDHPIKMRVRADVDECDMTGGFNDGEYDDGPNRPDNPKKHTNDINQVPNQNVKGIYQSIRKQMAEIQYMDEDKKSEYKTYFNNMLKKFGVDSVTDLDTEKKKAFFNKVNQGWKAQNEGWISQLIK